MLNVIGITTGVSKKGNPFTVLHCVGEFDAYQKNKGAQGKKVQEIYIPTNIDDPDFELGCDIELLYKPGYDGKAVVSGITVK